MLTISDGRYGTLTWVPPEEVQATIKALASRRKLKAMTAACRDSLGAALGIFCLARQLSQVRGLPARLSLSVRCKLVCRF